MAEVVGNENSVLPPMQGDDKAARKQLKDDKKALRKELKEQRKAAKQREAELAERTAELNGDDGGGVATLVVTLFIIVIWIIIMLLLIKLDVGGFGSNVLAPIIGDVPGINRILPEGSYTVREETAEYDDGISEELASNLEEANLYIKRLENELRKEMEDNQALQEENNKLQAEVARLEPFEEEQAQFEAEKEEFYKNIVYADNAPDESAYQSYYELIEPDIAAQIYAQIVLEKSDDERLQDYVKAYSSMKAKEAAAIFDQMMDEPVGPQSDEVKLISKILWNMSAENRGAILDKMKEENAGIITDYMDPPKRSVESVTGLGG